MRHKQIALDAHDRTAFGEVSVESLSAEFGGRKFLAEVSLRVAQGEVVGLLGRDGAGKTICFQAIAGLVPATSGGIYLHGLNVTGWPIDRRARMGLAYLPEEISIFRGLTVEENILLTLEASEPSPAARLQRLEALLANFELTVVRDQLATTISGGERRRCEIARAMALNPTIVLLDEPFRGLDPTSVASTKRAIGALRQHHVGVLVSDYDLHDLIDLLDRVYVLHHGKLIFSGTANQLMVDPQVREMYLGKSFAL